MSAVVNIFLNQAVPEDIAKIFTQAGEPTLVPLELTNTDPAYYHQAVLQGAISSLPSYEAPLPATVSAQFIQLPPPALRTPAMERELTFLDTMGLLVARGDAMYISPLTWVMYGPGGPFQEETQGISSEERRTIFAQTAALFLHYIIPGYVWRAFINRAALPDAIDLHTDMNRAMRGLQGLAARLEVIMGANGLQEPRPGVGARIAAAAGAMQDAVGVPRLDAIPSANVRFVRSP
jgi:hypothetical protein